ncbi:MAG: hypothetical protein DRO36_02830 [Candidatus Hecatellales archaeon]|nr:MAG: hypothetical protein DRO36_02830 [Candidatus Hecatellales archaeon]
MAWFWIPFLLGWWLYPYRYYYRYPYMPVFPWMPWLYPPTKEEELRILEDHAKMLEQQLNDIKRRMEELKKS